MNVYETHKMRDPRLPFIFHTTTLPPKTPAKYYNWHENIEIVYVIKGSGSIICGEHHLPVKAGEVIIINPNELHSFYTADQALCYYYFIVDRSFFLANHFDSNYFHFDSKVESVELVKMIERFAYYWGVDKDTEPMRVQYLRAIALEICLFVCSLAVFNKKPVVESHLLSCIKQAIGYIRAESHREISLDEIACAVGLSKYYFAREFRRITGYSCISYLNNVRCERVKELLLGSVLSIGDIGRECGFLNQSYFSKTFKEYVGCTPGQYRRKYTVERT